jgi:hypothetical protein
MESSFIPNSNPAIGRISTPWSAQLRKPNNTAGAIPATFGLTKAVESWWARPFNAQRSTLNAQRSIQAFECWALDVGRWTFVLFRRVKGAWWPSRSSKPLLIPHPRGQGRFDSYPLRPNRKLRSLGVEKLRREISTSSIEYPAFGRTNVRNGLLAFTSNLNHQTSNFPKGGE